MAASVGTVSVGLTANTSKLSSQLKGAVGSMKSWERATKKSMEAALGPTKKMELGIAKLNALQAAGKLTNAQYMTSVDLVTAAMLKEQAAIDAVTLKQVAQLPVIEAAIVKTSRLAVAQKALLSHTKGLAKSFAAGGILIGIFGVVRGLTTMFGAVENFNRSMLNSTAIMADLSDDQMQRMQDASFDVAKATKFSASEAADAFFFLASAGLNAEQSIASLATVGQFAAAGNFNMARATDILTDAVSALGLASDDTSEFIRNLNFVGDKLVKTATLANATVEQFGEALLNRGAAAIALANISLDEGLSILATFASTGFAKGSEAGTQLAIMLRDLSRSVGIHGEAWEDLVGEVDAGGGKFKDQLVILKMLEESMEGLTAIQKQLRLTDLGLPIKSQTALAVQLGTSDFQEKFREQIKDFEGFMERVAARQLTPFQKAFELLEATVTQIGVERFTDAIAEFAQALVVLSEVIGSVDWKRVTETSNFISAVASGGTIPLARALLAASRDGNGPVGSSLDSFNSAKGRLGRVERFLGARDKEFEETLLEIGKESEALANLRSVINKFGESIIDSRGQVEKFREQLEIAIEGVSGEEKETERARAEELIREFTAQGKAALGQESLDKARKEAEVLASEFQRLMSQVETPFEAAVNELKALLEFQALGLDGETFMRQQERIVSQFEQTLGPGGVKSLGPARGVVAGSQAAQSLLAQAQSTIIDLDRDRNQILDDLLIEARDNNQGAPALP